MSVLLDALKKAALEKQKRDRLAADGHDFVEKNIANKDTENNLKKSSTVVSHEVTTEEIKQNKDRPSSESESVVILPEPNFDLDLESTDNDLTFDIDIEALEELDLSERKIKESVSENKKIEEKDSYPLLDSGIHNSDNNESVQSESITLEPREVDRSPALVSVQEHDDVNNKNDIDKKTTENSNAINNTSDSLNVSPSPDKQKEDVVNKKNTTHEQQKEAFEKILQNNKNLAKKKKRMFMAMYLLLLIIAGFLVSAYYFYITVSGPNTFVGRVNVPLIPSVDEQEVMETDKILSEIDAEESDTEESDAVSNDVSASLSGESNKVSHAEKIHVNTQIKENKAIDSVPPSQRKVNPKVTPAVDKKTSASTSNMPDYRKKAKNIQNEKQVISLGEPLVDSLTAAVQRGFEYYNRGDFKSAQQAYDEALSLDSFNRDALLGRAAIAIAESRYEEALTFYQRRLARAPNDDYAHAGILSIATARQASPELMARVNVLLNDYPDASHLHFLQGSLHAAELQWHAAQASFFNAWVRDNQRADYAFNLAVSLDHMGSVNEALRFYRLSLRHHDNQHMFSAQLDVNTITRRIAQLENIENHRQSEKQ